jgi:O-antigen/teichoic acid export membrane protein
MRSQNSGRLVKNAVALIVSGGGTGLIGIVFWSVAAHEVSASTIGKTSAEIAAMILLATLAQLSFGSTFERFLPIAGDRTRVFIVRAYALCLSLALVLAILYVSIGLGHKFLPATFVWRCEFVVAVAMWTIFALQDSVMIGLRATRWVPVENILYSLTKLALVPAFVLVSARQGVLLAWLAPVIVMIITVNWYLFKRKIPQHQSQTTSSEKLPSLRQLISLTGAQYATLLVTVLSGSVVSLIVIDRLGAIASAHYYLPAQISGGAAVALWSIDRAFLVEASSEPAALRQHARVAMRAGVFVLLTSVIVGVTFAPEILKVFGPTYATTGTTLLRLMLLSLPGSAITAFYSSFAWLDKRVWKLVIRESVSAIVYFGLIFIFIGHFGIVAVGLAALISSVLEGLLFLPILVGSYRRAIRGGKVNDDLGASSTTDS